MKTFIKNRHNQKIAVVVEQPKGKPQGLAFVMHGLGGFKDPPHIRVMVQAFLDHECTVVSFDTTNTYGESDGDYADATVTNYYADLEDVIAWAKTENWYNEPFYLAGHSLGGICTALFAQKYPQRVTALAPISTVVSGKLSMEAEPNILEQWKRTGWRENPSSSRPGLTKRLKWNHMEDRLKYDLLPKVNKLTMPVLLVVGELDEPTPPKHQQILFDVLPGPKELHIIKGSPHTFQAPKHLKELGAIFAHWLDGLAS